MYNIYTEPMHTSPVATFKKNPICVYYCLDNHFLTKIEYVIDIKMCIFPDCKSRASFNYEGKKALYCSAHKLKNMIDVVSKRCAFPGCCKQSRFSYIGDNRLYCVFHRLPNMVDVAERCVNIHNIKTTVRYN